MNIERGSFKPIKKKLISLDNLPCFDSINLAKINALLNEVISGYSYNTIDLLTLLMNNYNGDLVSSIANIQDYSNVRFNCYHATKMLKKELNKIGIKSYLISYKSIGFSNSYGDSLIKEAHMSLVIPTIKENKVYYILLDPGLRIPEALCFFANDNETTLNIDNDIIKIKRTNDDFYNYTMEMTGYNRYSVTNTSYSCEEHFDITHELLNPEELLFPVSYYILSGYRIISFNVDKNKAAIIKLMLVEESLECSSSKSTIKIDFKEISLLTTEQLKSLLKSYTDILNEDLDILVATIKFMVDKSHDFINNVVDKNVK